MSILAILLLLMMLVAMLMQPKDTSILEKAVFYITSVIVVYQFSNAIDDADIVQGVNLLFTILVVAFALRVRFSYESTFQVTPLDYLVILLVIVIPNFPEVHLADNGIAEMAIKLIVLFYAGEAVMGMALRKRYLLRIGVVSALIIMLVKGV